jgi:HrpA-like RNA helicase
VNVVGQLLESSPAGDVLVFMPGERDIHETCDRLRRARRGLDVAPCLSLAAGDQ